MKDLKDVDDVRRLAGRTIEIKGPVKLYDGRAEIILNRISQIEGGATMIPRLPKNYEVENRGHFSAGHLRPTKKPAKTTATPNTTATYRNDVEDDEPAEGWTELGFLCPPAIETTIPISKRQVPT